jgi:hypothetical protein
MLRKIVLINASSGTTLSSPFCSSKSYPTVEMPIAGALKHTADEPIPDTEISPKKNRREKYQRQKHIYHITYIIGNKLQLPYDRVMFMNPPPTPPLFIGFQLGWLSLTGTDQKFRIGEQKHEKNLQL